MLWGLPLGTGPTLRARRPQRLPGGAEFLRSRPPGRRHDAIAGLAVSHSHLTHTNSITLSNGQGPPGTTRHTGQPCLPSRAGPLESKLPPCTKEGGPAARLMSDQPGRDPSALIKLLTQTGRPSEARLYDQCRTGQGRPRSQTQSSAAVPGVGGPTSRRLAGAVPDCTPHSLGRAGLRKPGCTTYVGPARVGPDPAHSGQATRDTPGHEFLGRPAARPHELTLTTSLGTARDRTQGKSRARPGTQRIPTRPTG